MRPNVSLGGVIEHPVPSNRRETLLSSGVVCLATGAMVLLENEPHYISTVVAVGRMTFVPKRDREALPASARSGLTS